MSLSRFQKGNTYCAWTPLEAWQHLPRKWSHKVAVCLQRRCGWGREEGGRAWFPHDSSQLVQHQVSASEEHWHMTSATTYLWPLSFNAVINLLILSLFDWFLGPLLSPCRHNMWILISMASVAARSSGSFCENRDLWNVSTIGRASNGRIIAWLSRPQCLVNGQGNTS